MEEIDVIKEKSNYCLNCKVKPCSMKGCPLNNDIPEFIRAVKEGRYEDAYNVLCKTTVLQPICGRICPHKKQCEGSCVRGIKGEPVSIGDLEAFVGDTALKNDFKLKFATLAEGMSTEQFEKNSLKKVAVIGAGPAGITCSAFLAQKGFKVTIYEKYNYLGGLLVHGIPEFRLPNKIVEDTLQKVIDLGVEIKYNMELGKNLDLAKLINEYDAIFLAIGANVSSKMGVEGETLNGVYGGNELLEYNLHPSYKGKKVAVVGGGNVAMDCARTIKRLGAEEVKVIYRRAEKQMPAEEKEVKEAKEEGIEFLFQNNIVKIIGEKQVEKVELIKTELVKKEGETREVPVNIEGSNYIIDIDYIVMALGSMPAKIVNDLDLQLNKKGYIEIDENGKTSNPKVFAGGDLAGCKGTVAWSAKSGRVSAEAIEKYLEGQI
jgi:glutamate synthase (NADPH/NADH) small chain